MSEYPEDVLKEAREICASVYDAHGLPGNVWLAQSIDDEYRSSPPIDVQIAIAALTTKREKLAGLVEAAERSYIETLQCAAFIARRELMPDVSEDRTINHAKRTVERIDHHHVDFAQRLKRCSDDLRAAIAAAKEGV